MAVRILLLAEAVAFVDINSTLKGQEHKFTGDIYNFLKTGIRVEIGGRVYEANA